MYLIENGIPSDESSGFLTIYVSERPRPELLADLDVVLTAFERLAPASEDVNEDTMRLVRETFDGVRLSVRESPHQLSYQASGLSNLVDALSTALDVVLWDDHLTIPGLDSCNRLAVFLQNIVTAGYPLVLRNSRVNAIAALNNALSEFRDRGYAHAINMERLQARVAAG